MEYYVCRSGPAAIWFLGLTLKEECINNKVGLWEGAGSDGVNRIIHRTPRRALFTPHHVAGGPGRNVRSGKSRVTTGTFLEPGDSSMIEDRYTKPSTARLMLERGWIRIIEFRGGNLDSYYPSW